MPTRKTFVPSDSVKQRISKWEGVAMTGSSIDPLSKKWVKQNNSFENEAALFSSALPESIRNHVLSNQDLADNLFSYSYNVGSGKFKRRVVPALVKYFNREGTSQDIADAMVAQGDTKLRGLKNRREQEKSGVLSAIPSRFNYGISFPLNTAPEQPDALRVATPYSTQVNNTFITPTIVPDDYVKAHQVTMEEDRANRAMQRIEAAKKYDTLMQSIGMFNNTTPQFVAPYSVSPYAEGGRINTTSKWDTLSMAQKAKMIKVAVGNGITNLNEIKQKYNEFAEGGGISDEEYYSTMEKVAEDNYQKWGFGSPDEALVHALNDNTYNYRGYYEKYPQSAANADTHWPDEFKTVYHPTFSRESIYSGKKSQYNPNGRTGGFWLGEVFVPAPWQLFNNHAEGGKIHIDPSKKGTFTAAASKHGMEVQQFASKVLAHPENYSPAMRKKANFARNASKWKHGLGGNLFDGTSQDSQQMQIGLKATNSWKPYTIDDILANAVRIKQQKQAIENGLNNAFILSNDATSIANGRPQNRHLERKAIEGAKSHAAWDKEHPIVTQWGNVLGAVPFAVAAYPLAATAGSGIAALGDMAAATTAGKAVTSFLAPAVPALPWLDAGLASMSGAHGVQAAIEEGGVSPMTALELSPMLRLGKPLSETAGTAYSNLADKYPGLEQYPRYAIGKFKYGFDAELPTLYRKLKGALPIADANGNIALTNPNSRFRYIETGEDPMITNFTTDVPVRSHPSGHWEEGDVLALNGKTLLGHKVVSTRPSDTFTIDSRIKAPVNKTTFITGDKDMATQAQSVGYKVYSPEELQIQYQTADNAANNAGRLAHREDFFKGYEDFIERETRGLFKAPTAKDYAFMDYVFKPTYTSQTEPLSNLAAYKTRGMMTAPMWLRRLAGTNDYKWRGVEHLDGNVLYHPYDPVESIFRRENGIEILRKIPQVIRDSWKNK